MPLGGAFSIGYKHAARFDPAGSGVFVEAFGSYGPAAGGIALSPSRRLCGGEVFLGPIAKGSKIYGDRVVMPILPGFVILSASRTGGLGITCQVVPIPHLLYPLFRAKLSFFVSNPTLVKPACMLIDRFDALCLKGRTLLKPITSSISQNLKKICWRCKQDVHNLKRNVKNIPMNRHGIAVFTKGSPASQIPGSTEDRRGVYNHSILDRFKILKTVSKTSRPGRELRERENQEGVYKTRAGIISELIGRRCR